MAEEVEDRASLKEVENLHAAIEGRGREKVSARVEGHLEFYDTIRQPWFKSVLYSFIIATSTFAASGSGRYLSDSVVVARVELLQFPHPDVEHLDLFVGGSDSDAVPSRMEVQVKR